MINDSKLKSCVSTKAFLLVFAVFPMATFASSDALLDIFWDAASTHVKATNPRAEIYKIDVGEVTRMKCPPKALISEKHMHDFILSFKGSGLDYKVLAIYKNGFVDRS